MPATTTTYGAYAIVNGKRVEVKNAKTYSEALALLKIKIAEVKGAKP